MCVATVVSTVFIHRVGVAIQIPRCKYKIHAIIMFALKLR